jgi:ribosomal protein S8
MIYNYFYNYTTNHFQINSSKKSLYFQILYTKKVFNLVRVFKKLGLIRSFFIIKNKNFYYIKIFNCFYKKFPVCSYWKILSTPSKSFHISLKALRLLHNRTQNSVYLLSTTRGVITHLDALKFQIGGQLVLFITL